MCLYIYIYIYIYIYMCVCVCMYMARYHGTVHVFVCISMCICVYRETCLRTELRSQTNICITFVGWWLKESTPNLCSQTYIHITFRGGGGWRSTPYPSTDKDIVKVQSVLLLLVQVPVVDSCRFSLC